jgi:5S rRNA maturation endonuclease (ribonuclease M5)
MILTDFLTHFKNVRKNGSGYMAQSPLRSDSTPSLSITEGEDGRILIHDFGAPEAAPEDILRAIGLEMKDLMPERDFTPRPAVPLPEKPKKRVTADQIRGFPFVKDVYDYPDESGSLLYIITRSPDKKFTQWRLVGNGFFESGMDGVRRVPYRLPEVIDAVRQGRPVFIVEGEKDVNNLVKIGLDATCNPGGAGKWRPEFNEHLRGAHVIILPDNDDPGRKHAEDVAGHLYGIAAEVKVLDLSERRTS